MSSYLHETFKDASGVHDIHVVKQDKNSKSIYIDYQHESIMLTDELAIKLATVLFEAAVYGVKKVKIYTYY